MTEPRAAGSLGQLRESDLIKKGGVYVVSSGISQAVMLASWLVLSWAMSTAEIGQFALVAFGIDLMTRLMLLGMDSAAIRYLGEPDQRVGILRALHLWLAIGTTAVGLLAWMTRHTVPRLVTALAPVYSDLIWLMLAAAVATALATIVFSYHIATGAATRYASATVMRSLLTGGGFLMTAVAGLGVAGLVAAQCLAALVVLIGFYREPDARSGWGRANPAAVRRVARYGLPMTGYAIVALLSDYLGRLLIGWRVSIEALGVFQFFYQIALQVNGLWASLNRAWTPYVFQLLGSDRTRAFEQIKRGLAFGSTGYAAGLLLCMAAGLAGLWRFVLAPSMAGATALLYVLLLGPLYTAVYTACYPAFYYQENTVRVSVVQSFVSLGTMLATVVLTTRFAGIGAALAWVIGIFVTPIAYFAGFPRLRAELRPLGAAVVIWGVAGTLVVIALVHVGSTLLAAAVLATASVGVLAWRAGTRAAQPATV